MTRQPTRSVLSFFLHRSTNEPLSLGAVIAVARNAASWSLQKLREEIGTQRLGMPMFLGHRCELARG